MVRTCGDPGEDDAERLGGLLGARLRHDSDLRRLLETWDRLPEVVKTALVAAAEAGANVRG